MCVNDLEMRAIHIVCSIFGEKTQYLLHILHKLGANPNIQDVHGRSPLHFAASCGNISALTYLVRNFPSINLNLKTFGGETSMFKAVQNLRIDCLSILLQAGADPTLESFDGESIFQMAEQYENLQMLHVLEEYKKGLTAT
jgi:ankyrin repeat protein